MLGLGGVCRRRDGGFSLVELMVVVAITSILAAVAIPAYFNHTMRSRQSAAVGELMAIKGAQERYFAENGRYAESMKMLRAGAGPDTYTTSGTYVSRFYRYWVDADTTATTGFIMAEGDLNGDGSFNDRWQITIEDLDAKPEHDDTGSNEGFTWSSLGNLFK